MTSPITPRPRVTRPLSSPLRGSSFGSRSTAPRALTRFTRSFHPHIRSSPVVSPSPRLRRSLRVTVRRVMEERREAWSVWRLLPVEFSFHLTGSLVSLATRLTREPYPPPTLPLTTLYIPSHPIPLPPTRGPAFGLPSGPRVRGNDSG